MNLGPVEIGLTCSPSCCCSATGSCRTPPAPSGARSGSSRAVAESRAPVFLAADVHAEEPTAVRAA